MTLFLDDATKNADNILVLGRGSPSELKKLAKSVNGRVIDKVAVASDSKALFKHIHSEMRKAD